MWGIARVDLQLTDDEFFALSYRQFTVLYDRLLSLRWRQEWQRGSIAAAIYRNGMRSYNPMPGPDDFTFTQRPGTKPKTVKRPSKRKLRANVAAFFRGVPAKRA